MKRAVSVNQDLSPCRKFGPYSLLLQSVDIAELCDVLSTSPVIQRVWNDMRRTFFRLGGTPDNGLHLIISLDVTD